MCCDLFASAPLRRILGFFFELCAFVLLSNSTASLHSFFFSYELRLFEPFFQTSEWIFHMSTVQFELYSVCFLPIQSTSTIRSENWNTRFIAHLFSFSSSSWHLSGRTDRCLRALQAWLCNISRHDCWIGTSVLTAIATILIWWWGRKEWNGNFKR